MLYIHGPADAVIPYRMTEGLYGAKPGGKLLLTHGSYRVSAQQLGDAVRRDANRDALVRELEDVSGRY